MLKRKQYDMFGADGFNQRFSQEDIFRDVDLGSIFKEFGFGGGGRGQNIFTHIFGGSGQTQFRGGGSPYGSRYGEAQARKGQDLVYELPITLEEAATTSNKVISYQVGDQQNNVSVKVPGGIFTGKKLRLRGKGQPSPYGGPNGDLYIQIKVLEHPVFKREGDDLTMKREIKYSEAILGTEIEVTTIDKKTLRLKINAGTQNNAKFRLKGYGMPHMDGKGRGDTYVVVTTTVPKKLNKKQKDLVKELAGIGL